MTTFICPFCDERCSLLIDGDFCEVCYDGPTDGETKGKV